MSKKSRGLLNLFKGTVSQELLSCKKHSDKDADAICNDCRESFCWRCMLYDKKKGFV